jgi:hypothetical protein
MGINSCRFGQAEDGMAETTGTGSGTPPRGKAAANPAQEGQNQSGANGSFAEMKGAFGDVKEIGTELAAAVRDNATSIFEEQRDRVADEIAALGTVLQNSVKSLDPNGTTGSVARSVDGTAQQIGDFAEKLRQRSFGEIAGDVEGFARRWPMAFFASAIGIGFIAGRFITSSTSHKAADAPAEPAKAPSSSGTTGRREVRNDYGTVSTGAGAPGTSAAGGRDERH